MGVFYSCFLFYSCFYFSSSRPAVRRTPGQGGPRPHITANHLASHHTRSPVTIAPRHIKDTQFNKTANT